MDLKNKNNLLLIAIIIAITLTITSILLLLKFPDFVMDVAANWFAALFVSLGALVFGLIMQTKNKPIVIWNNREAVTPTFRERINKMDNSLFMVGISFETTFLNYKEPIKKALANNKDIKILILDPDSKHIEGHQPFSDRDIRAAIIQTINHRLKDLFDELSASEKMKLNVRATKYLPRFSANIWDNNVMFVNFYLYKNKANNNPVIEIKKNNNTEEFQTIMESLNKLFDHQENRIIISEGKWQEERNKLNKNKKQL